MTSKDIVITRPGFNDEIATAAKLGREAFSLLAVKGMIARNSEYDEEVKAVYGEHIYSMKVLKNVAAEDYTRFVDLGLVELVTDNYPEDPRSQHTVIEEAISTLVEYGKTF